MNFWVQIEAILDFGLIIVSFVTLGGSFACFFLLFIEKKTIVLAC
jgi:hypothetical protein